MLGDNSEKSKNPLKKAMRRRNAKNVTFTAPTYIEASDIDWSTEDEIDDGDSLIDAGEIMRDDDDLQDDRNDDIVVEPLRPKSNRDKVTEDSENTDETQQSGSTSPEKQRSSQELFEAASTRILLCFAGPDRIRADRHSRRTYCQQISEWYREEHGFVLQRRHG